MKLFLHLQFLLLTIYSFGQLPTHINIDSMLKAQEQAAIGQQFPAFRLTDGGVNESNDSLRGKVVLINFWFEGCHPCLTEFNALNELYQKFKGNKDFEFISFTNDNKEAIKRVHDTYGIKFKIFAVKDAEFRRLNFGNGFPTSIILDRNGKISKLFSGGFPEKERAREFVMTKLLSEITRQL